MNTERNSPIFCPTAIGTLDINRYMGVWFEIARIENWFEKGLACVTATYQVNQRGHIGVLNEGWKEGKRKRSFGKAKREKGNETGYLKVSFFLWFYSPYYVLHIDEQGYRYALVGSKTPNYLWILSRTPQLDETVKTKLISIADKQGYRVECLQWTKQFI